MWFLCEDCGNMFQPRRNPFARKMMFCESCGGIMCACSKCQKKAELLIQAYENAYQEMEVLTAI